MQSSGGEYNTHVARTLQAGNPCMSAQLTLLLPGQVQKMGRPLPGTPGWTQAVILMRNNITNSMLSKPLPC